jgi:hypothetical protein
MLALTLGRGDPLTKRASILGRKLEAKVAISSSLFRPDLIFAQLVSVSEREIDG